MAAVPRRRRLQRRRVEDEGEDDVDMLDDDSLTEGSIASDDHDAANDSDTSNVDDASPTAPDARKTTANGITKAGRGMPSEDLKKAARPVMTDTEIMLNGLSLADPVAPIEEINFDDLQQDSPTKTAAPIVVSSASASIPKPSQNASVDAPFERRRREHEEYRKKRDEDPAFVPNRGAFFMHDHRGAGPSANGFRPFNRGGGRGGRGRGGFGGHVPFIVHTHMNIAADPTTNAPWSHDMHDTVVKENLPMQSPRHNVQYVAYNEGPANGNGVIPRRMASTEPINRTLSTEKHIGNAQVRVFFPPLKQPIIITGLAVKQYTKLPDHRPPLRRDKPVRISLPHNPPRYVYPASDRSFIFIPRAMRPNQQQRVRGKPRSVFGSVGGFSRRTSIYGGGGGSYYGSVYSPSVAMSRRSSINFDMGRDHVISPTGSTMSRPPLPIDMGRPPVVRLPPTAPPMEQHASSQSQAPHTNNVGPVAPNGERPVYGGEASINHLPQPQIHPLPQKPAFQESRPAQLPMHQPRPQKTVSVETIESPNLSSNTAQSFQQAFHQQVPVQVSNNMHQDTHHRRPSHPPHVGAGTPLSQIPERAIHAAPFQPNAYAQQNYYGAPQPYPPMQPQQGYYYPPPQQYPGGMQPSATAPAFVPGVQQQPMHMHAMPHAAPQGEVGLVQPNGQPAANPTLITQEVNGTFYFYDATQLPAVNNYPPYGAQPYVPVGMPGMMAPSPDGFYYPQTAPGMMYYSQ